MKKPYSETTNSCNICSISVQGEVMPRFDRQAFNHFLIDNHVVGFFKKPVTLKSGRQSNWYVNWRTIGNDAFMLGQLSDFLIAFAQEKAFELDAFYGVPEGATKLGVLATYKWASAQNNFKPGSHRIPMGRGKPKEHGAPQDKFFVGEPKGKIVVVEDVTTTGGSLLTALDRIGEIDAKVIAAVGLTNRMEKRDDGLSVEEAVAARGVAYYSLSEATDFLPQAFHAFCPGEAIARAIEEEFKKFGVKPLKML